MHHGGIWQPSVAQSHSLSGLFPSHHTHSVSCRSYNHITLLTKATESHDQLLAIIPLMKNREWDGSMRNKSETTNTENKKWGGWEGGQGERFIIQEVTPLMTCLDGERETHSKLQSNCSTIDFFLTNWWQPIWRKVSLKRNYHCLFSLRPNIVSAIVSSIPFVQSIWKSCMTLRLIHKIIYIEMYCCLDQTEMIAKIKQTSDTYPKIFCHTRWKKKYTGQVHIYI